MLHAPHLLSLNSATLACKMHRPPLNKNAKLSNTPLNKGQIGARFCEPAEKANVYIPPLASTEEHDQYHSAKGRT